MVTSPAPSDAPAELPLVHVIDDLERLKVLADPLRLRILEALCAEARTTKQVAAVLDEPPTRLYHHVDTLERAGLVQLERTRPVRGTVEKYYRAVARAFRADPSLFELDGGGAQAAVATKIVAAELLESAAAQLRATAFATSANETSANETSADETSADEPAADETAGRETAEASPDSKDETELLVVNFSLRRLGRERLAEARRRLEALLEEMQGWADADAGSSEAGSSEAGSPEGTEPADAPEHRLVVALYPLDTASKETQETSP